MDLSSFKLGFTSRDSGRPGSDGYTAWTAPEAAARAVKGSAKWWSLAAAPGVAVVGVWLAIRAFPSFGPMLADTLRAVVGSETVTVLEEMSANVEDRVRQKLGATPRGLDEMSSLEGVMDAGVPVKPMPSASQTVLPNEAAEPVFQPADVGPMFASMKSTGDGVWHAVTVRGDAENGGAPLLYRSMVHPDPERAYAELFVFALDLKRVELRAVAGTIEPKNEEPANGPGRIAEQDWGKLIAAFNGGFKAEHGKFGMMADGLELLAPRPGSCTIAGHTDGRVRVGTWTAIESERGDFVWWRQTPACMVEAGALHPGLQSGTSRRWGATIDGDTVIRRSALGVSADGSTLFVGISNSTTARALATGMQHAGAHQVAQLDVNHSFPKFALYKSDAKTGQPKAVGAVKGFLVGNDDYVGDASTRDFFYVTRR